MNGILELLTLRFECRKIQRADLFESSRRRILGSMEGVESLGTGADIIPKRLRESHEGGLRGCTTSPPKQPTLRLLRKAVHSHWLIQLRNGQRRTEVQAHGRDTSPRRDNGFGILGQAFPLHLGWKLGEWRHRLTRRIGM